MDRLGDLVCTLPVDQHPALTESHAEIIWLVTQGLEPILDCAIPKRNYITSKLTFTLKNFFELYKKIRQHRFSKVILFYAPWWIGLLCLISRIPARFSPRSRWYQFIFFNHSLRQKRSLSEKHEAQYNWELTHWSLTKELQTKSTPPFLELKSPKLSMVPLLPSEYIVIHPGMGGSALNWPTHFYFILAKKLVELEKRVIITGTQSDEPWLKNLESPLKSLPGLTWLVGQLDLKTLLYVLSRSAAVVAPSTGVLHLAASTGVKTIGIYSPIRVQTPVRWGPRGVYTRAYMPNVECPAKNHCLEEACELYPCLERITPEHILNDILRQ